MSGVANLVSLSFIFLALPSIVFNLCVTNKTNVYSGKQCENQFFEYNDKTPELNDFTLALKGDSLDISLDNVQWDDAYLRLAQHENSTFNFCTHIKNTNKSTNFHYECLSFFENALEKPFILDLSTNYLLLSSTRKISFSLPNSSNKFAIFSYVDLTLTSNLILKAHKLPKTLEISYYKVEAFKESDNATVLLDLRLFDENEDIIFELSTYNDEGNYFFAVSIISKDCPEDYCPKSYTPKIYIGRKRRRLIIGIVGASFVLPFLLILFHVLTKKTRQDEKLELCSQVVPKIVVTGSDIAETKTLIKT